MTLFKNVGCLANSHTGKTYRIDYDLEELLRIAECFRTSRNQRVFLGLIRRREMHDSIHAFPSFPVEISQFVNYLSPERKSPTEILNSITEKEIENQ